MPLVRSDVAQQVIVSAITVHKALGPGLLESAYSHCLAEEFAYVGLAAEWQVPLPITYRNARLDCGYRIDCVVENTLLLELKSVARLLPIHDAQVLTYMKLFKMKQGLLMNFNSKRLVDGLKSFLL